MPVVDASVWVAINYPADLAHARCVAWYQSSQTSSERLLAPTLLVAEVAAAIRRLTGEETLAREVVEKLVELGIFELIHLDRERSVRAAGLAAATGVRGADAVYLALAQERDDVLVTIDRQQRLRGEALVRILEP